MVASSLALGDVTATATATEPDASRLVAVNRAISRGLAGAKPTWAASAVDYNRDGAQDVWIGYHGQGGKLWRNRGKGSYRRVTKSAWPAENRDGKTIDRHDCAWADVDRNGHPDAYCTTGRFHRNLPKQARDNELWLQDRRGRFREVGTAWGVGNACGRGRHVAFLDANGDRYPDLFVGNETPRDVTDPCDGRNSSPRNEHSRLYLNTRGTGFRYAPRYWHFGSGPGSRCAQVLDYNDDGWDDLLTCRERRVPPQLYRNRSGHGFANVTSAHRLDAPVTDADVADIDRDGDPDVVTSSVGGFGYHRNNDGRFGPRIPVGNPPVGMGVSVAVANADADRDLDVYGMVGNGPRKNPDDAIWRNDRMTFDPIKVPSAAGAAQQVVALHPRDGQRAEFLVLNGFGRAVPPGPTQLIRLVPSN